LLQAQEDVGRYLDSFQKKYSALKDYTVNVHVHFDIEGFKAPDMQATFFFKAPDQMKFESKKVFFFPKEGGTFNPFFFKKEDFEIKLLERSNDDNKKVIKLKLTPKKSGRGIQGFVLSIDTDRNLIGEMNISSTEGREVKASIEYGQFGGFELPTRMLLRLDIPFNESVEIRDFGQPTEKTKRVTGKVEITYSNYKVNSGLSDKIFKETEPSISR
jgi:hypothetical protein